MQTLTDIAAGMLTWTIALSSIIGTFVAAHYIYGPPMEDRARSFAFMAGGAMALMLTLLTISVMVTIIINTRAT